MSSRFSTCFSIKQSSGEFRQRSREKANHLPTQVVHATASSHRKKSKDQAFVLSSTAFSVCLALSSYSLPTLMNPAFADAPKGGVIVGGKGDISKVDATTLINQSSHHMAINWDSYNLSANETVRYVQPSASAVSLNRILGVNGSTIAGNIESNGQVILINPNGLVFTDTAVLNVGGIIASGLDMSPSDFMNGDYIFNELTFDGGDSVSSGRVINRGLINASLGGKGGNVALIGKQVVNEGLIEAQLGSVTLAAGKQAVLTFDAGGVLGVKVSEAILQEELGVDPALINSGEINAQGGRVLLTASTSQDVFSQAVNSGLDQATSVVVHDDGSFTLGGGADVVNSGKIDVSSHTLDLNTSNAGQIVVLGENITSSGEILANANSYKAGKIEVHAQDTLMLTEQSLTSARGHTNSAGGTIKALGDKVGLFDSAIVDVSGSTGGDVYIGGDVQGLNPLMPNATFTYLGENTQVLANGLSSSTNASDLVGNFNSGDGGQIIVFAEDTSRVYGQLSAIGGLSYGDGGFIETSGLQSFDIQTVPQVFAANGQGGEWLIDPNNIKIVENNGNSGINDDTPFLSTNDSALLGVNLINSALESGVDVTITTGSAGTNAQNGDIDWGDDFQSPVLSFNNRENGSLTLNASNNITFTQGKIYDSNQGSDDSLNLILNAGGGISVADGFEISTNSGYIEFNPGTGAVNFNSSIITTESGNITINDTAAGVDFGTSTINTGGGSLEIFETAGTTAAQGSVNFNASSITTGGGHITIFDADGSGSLAAGNVNFGLGTGIGSFNTGGGNITIGDATGGVDFGSGTGANAINTSGGNLVVFETNVGSSAQGLVDFNAREIDLAGGALTIFDAAATDVAVQGVDFGTSNINAEGGVVINNTAGIIDLASSTITTGGGAFTSLVSASVTSTASSINTTGATNIDGGAIHIETTGALTLDSLTADGGASSGSQGDSAQLGRSGGDITLESFGDGVTVNGALSTVGKQGNYNDPDATGQNGGDGGDVLITAGNSTNGSINIAEIVTSGGAASGNNASSGGSDNSINEASGGHGGIITLTAAVDIIAANSLNTIGGVGVGQLHATNKQGVGGNGGDITITANSATLNADINTSVGAVNLEALAGVTEGTVNINLSGSDGIATIGHNSAFTTQVNITGNNSQSLISTSTFDGVEWFIDGAGDGSWRDANNNDTNTNALNLVFTGIENVTGGNNADVFNITQTGSIAGIIDGGNGTNTLERSNSSGTNTWLIDGTDTGTLNGTRFNQIQTLTGSTVNDDFSLTSASANIATINGGTGNNSLTARDADNEWHITGNNSGVLYQDNTADGFGVSYVDSFTDIQTLIGNSNIDNFVIGSGGNIDSIDGGSGGNNSLTARDTDNEWDVSGANSGILYQDNASANFGTSYVDSFNNIQSLIGSDANLDIFVMATGASISAINGGADNNNTLIADDVANEWHITSADAGVLYQDNAGAGFGTSYVDGFTNVQHLKGSESFLDIFVMAIGSSISSLDAGGDGDNTLIARDADNEWHITSDNGGVLYQDNAADGFGVSYVDSFTDIQTLIGNSNIDNFVIGSGGSIDSIDGVSGGNNSLTARDTDNEWDVSGANSGKLYQDNAGANFGTSYVDSFNNIQSLIGSDTNLDIFVMATGASISAINGGIDGNNTLVAKDLANEWHITGENGGVLYLDNAATGFSGAYVNSFNNIQHLSGSESFLDIFVMATGSSIDNINAGSDGDNTLIARDADNEWHITGNNSGVIYQDNAADGFGVSYVDSFTDIQTLIGNSNIDNFVIGSGGNIDSIDGGSGGNNSLTARDTDNEWDVSGANSGILYQDNASANFGTSYVDSFNNIQSLIGSDANLDIFVMATGASISAINGGADNNNTLIADDVANEWHITGENGGVLYLDNAATGFSGAYVNSFNNIQNLSGSESFLDIFVMATGSSIDTIDAGSNGDNTLIARDADNEWHITGGNSGVLYQDNAADGFGVSYVNSFTDIQTLIGNSNIDNFVIGSGGSIDSIDGGSGGNNSLTARDTDNEWDVSGANSGILYQDNAAANFGASYVDSFSNIESLIGSNNNLDIFVMGATASINNIDGGSDGNNTLTARQGVVNSWSFNSLTSGSLSQLTPLELYVTNFVNIKSFVGGGMGGEWADLSGTSAAVDVASYFGFTGIIGNGTDSHLVGQDGVVNTWQIESVLDSGSVATDGLNDGTFTNTNDSILFIDFVTLTGGNSTDNFTISNTGSFNGTINGGSGTNTVQAKDAALNTWAVTSSGIGSLNDAATTFNFTGMDNLLGGVNVDNFTLSDITHVTGLIDGGDGVDSVAITANNQDVALGTDISNIETLSAQAGTNTLRGTNTTNDWNITTANIGTVNDQTTTLSFTNFSELVGGTLVDDFLFASAGSVNSLAAGTGEDIISVDNITQVATTIDGGGNDDILNLNSAGQTITLDLVTSIETINAAAGNNFLQGGSGTNTWTITSENAGMLNTTNFSNFNNLIGGADTDNFTLADMALVTGLIDGGTGTDKIDITGSTAQDITLGTDIARIETLNAQVGTNTLRGESATNDWRINTANTGTIDDQTTTLSFSNFSELVGGTLVDDFLFASAGSVNSLAAGTGEDVISVDNISQVATTIDGGGNDDILNLNTDGQIITLASVTSIETINATAGNNTLQGGSGTNTWTITSENAGMLNTTNFTHFNNLTGGGDTDNFTLSDITHVTGLIDGGDGVDSVAITANNQDVALGTDITNIETLSAQAGTNTLRGTNTTNDWNITTANIGTVNDQTTTLSFTNFSELVGGTLVDDFLFASAGSVNSLAAGTGEDIISVDNITQVATTIDGGGNDDILNLNTAGQTITLDLVTSIETINAAAGNNFLQGGSGTNTWTITSENAGMLNTTNFSNFNNLIGGADTDNFTLADMTLVTGLIDGGAGTDKIDITGSTAQDITLGTDIARIETLNAEVGTNTLRGESATNYWDITDANKGEVNDQTTILTFTNFSELVGGTAVDDFYFFTNGVVNSVNAGDGNDIVSLSDISQIITSMDGGSGTDDRISLRSDNQVVNLTNLTNFENLYGTGTNNILQGSNTTNTWIIDNANEGSVNYGSNTLNFYDFTDLEGGSLVDTFTITAALNSLDAGAGDDIIIVRELSDVANTINGGANDDKVTLTNNNQSVNISDAVIGVETIVGTGDNTLLANGATNTWLIDGVNQGSVNDGVITVNFENFTDLQGSDQIDNFTVTATGSVDSIHAGAGTDSVLLASVSSVNDAHPQIELDGGTGTDSLTVDTSGNTWAFTTDTDGSVSNGGVSRDFANFTSHSSAAGSADTFDYSGYNGNVTVDLNSSTGIGTVIGNLNFTSTLIAIVSTENTWQVASVNASDGANDGSVSDGTTTVSFQDFNVLTGGNSTDNFTITDTGTFDGTINGGSGTNTLTGSNNTNTWVVNNDNSGNVTYSGITTFFNGIEHLVGGSGVDNFTVTAALSSLVAGDDDDVINLDVISRVASAIDGGSGDDTVNISSSNQTVDLATDIIRVENLNGTGSNTLESGNTDNTWTVDTDNDGTFSDNVTLVNFTNFSELVGGSGVDTVTLTANIETLNTGGGDDIINVDLLSRVSNSIDGGANNDTLNVSLSGQTIELGNGFTGVETLNGTGSNTLQASNSNNTWEITGSNKGTVDDNVSVITFNNFSTLIGGNLSDSFTLSDINHISGLINGGVGTDTITLRSANQSVVLGSDITSIENLNGKAGSNTLQGEDVASTWVITGNDQGSVSGTSFTNFSDLVGGSADDSFTLATINQISGVIDGGSGNNTVTLTSANQHIILDTDIQHIDTLVATAGNNTLQGADISNNWTITDNNEGSVAGVSFSNISDLVGGSGVDSFTLETIDQITGLIDGGASSDSLTLTTANQTLNLNTDITQLENLNATTSTLVAHDEVNVWLIDASDSGTLTNTHGAVSFKGFAHLSGGSSVDSFTISGASGDISGLISGGDGSDSLALSSIQDRVIELGSDVTGNLNVDHIEKITANTDSTNTLIADNVENTWLIDGNEAGSITYNGITAMFSNFEHLIGGSAVDKFTVNDGGVTSIAMGQGNDAITSNAGNIALVSGNEGDDIFTVSGGSLENIQGGEGTDYVGYSLDNVSITLGDHISGFEGISALQGNGTLNAQDDVTTTWIIDDENKGQVIDSSASSSSLIFSGFATINGGSGVDNYIVNDNGAITGIINGGANADTLTVNLNSTTRTQTGTINFNGGTGNDVVTIEGTADKFAESYTPNIQVDGEQFDQLSFAKDNSTVNVDVNYRNVASVNDNITSTSLTLNNSLSSDTLYLDNSSFSANSALVSVSFSASNKGDIKVLAHDNSNLIITNDLTTGGDLTITANEVTQEAGVVSTQRLILDEVTELGRSDNSIEVNVEELIVQNHRGEIYLNEQDDIVLSELSNTSGGVSVNSEAGSITSSNVLISSGDMELSAKENVSLLAQNELTGNLTLAAGSDVVVNNNAMTIVTNLSAVNATITSVDSLLITGDVGISGTNLSIDSNQGILSLTSIAGDISVNGHIQAHTATLRANNDINLASIETSLFDVDATNGDITASDHVVVQSDTQEVSTLLNAENGAITLEHENNDFDGVSLVANDASITDQNGLGLTNVELSDNLVVNANGDIAVSTITAGRTITIDSGAGAIVSNQSSLTADEITLHATSGVGVGSYDEFVKGTNGADEAINTHTANLSVTNTTSGTVNIKNSQAVTITDLRNNGDIVFTNTGDITLKVTTENGEAVGAVDANYGQDITNDVYSGQVAILNSGEDSLYTTGLGLNEADITAESLFINSVNFFGTASQPIRLRVNENFTLIGVLASLNYFGGEPVNITTSEGLTLQVISTITGLSGQQLVEVESLDEVDPAIFADVRNYNVDDTSVLLPRDQRNIDDEDFEEGEE